MVDKSQELTPADFLHFVELDEFSQDWESLGLNLDDDMWALCTAIMLSPDGAPIIKGTGGLRKLRFAPAAWKTGKSSAVRVCYAYFPKHWTVLLVMAYGKNVSETITAAEKRGIKQYLEAVQAWLDNRNG